MASPQSYPDLTGVTVAQIIPRLNVGGAEMTTGARPVVRGAVELFFAGERLEDDKTLHEQGVPPGCKCLAAVDATLLEPGAKPDSQSAYWC